MKHRPAAHAFPSCGEPPRISTSKRTESSRQTIHKQAGKKKAGGEKAAG
ncbi:hypothetical protein BIFADO_02445 [Bifidobacterium adolescentis L2-32]|uniref:Uncharacterized protein n=1 Tax=Bifidobacterium adolescentis L2-32 TaxID=411481 RepID=A7A998_BIFAD|nr:hypothetical protein BIFADO_02445 [Bifidobacterium adolescentis L2-32]